MRVILILLYSEKIIRFQNLLSIPCWEDKANLALLISNYICANVADPHFEETLPHLSTPKGQN